MKDTLDEMVRTLTYMRTLLDAQEMTVEQRNQIMYALSSVEHETDLFRQVLQMKSVSASS